MKNIIQITMLTCIIFVLQSGLNAQTTDTITMGASYADDVFYSLENGVVKAEPRNNWDLGFYTNRWSAGIIINDGTGVKLFAYPKGDTAAWSTMDTAGMNQWTNLYNSDTIWEDGAFNRNALGHPDYGWGTYNMVSHDVIGDSLFILQRADGSLKKVWIERKNSVANTFYFKYADIDGQHEVTETLDATPYESKLFIYYSTTNQQLIDREPEKTTWDLLFSKYAAIVYDSEGIASYYLVVGATSNVTDSISRNHPVIEGFEDWSSTTLNGDKSTIGHDWKSFSMNTFSWEIEDSLAFFVKNTKGDIYKLVFDYFSGSSTGRAGFVKKLLSLSAVDEPVIKTSLTIFPNPAVHDVTILIDKFENNAATLKIYDQSGRLTYSEEKVASNNQLKINVSSIPDGLYILEIVNGNNAIRQKMMVKH
jgi:phosphohistidine swiveling domain-containing protein